MTRDATQLLTHVVCFSLQENSPQARQKFIEICHQYLSGHPGTLHFNVGIRVEEYDRPVNDKDFDVALVLVFASKEDHDHYQASERHQQFLAEQSDSWSQVRVFDFLGAVAQKP